MEGGKLDAEDIVGRDDIAAVGLESRSEEILASPNTKVEYDSHGFIQDVNCLVLGHMDWDALDRGGGTGLYSYCTEAKKLPRFLGKLIYLLTSNGNWRKFLQIKSDLYMKTQLTINYIY